MAVYIADMWRMAPIRGIQVTGFHANHHGKQIKLSDHNKSIMSISKQNNHNKCMKINIGYKSIDDILWVTNLCWCYLYISFKSPLPYIYGESPLSPLETS